MLYRKRWWDRQSGGEEDGMHLLWSCLGMAGQRLCGVMDGKLTLNVDLGGHSPDNCNSKKRQGLHAIGV